VPIVAFFGLIWFVGLLEDLQIALFIASDLPKGELRHHSIACLNIKLALRGSNLRSFLFGRQVLVTACVFLVGGGLALTLVTVVVGQLTSQINAANCMLDFVNTRFMLFTSYVSLTVEASGILHGVYLVQIFFAFVTRQSITTKKSDRTILQTLLFWLRVALSLVVLSASLVVVVVGILRGWTASYPGAPRARYPA